MPAVIRRLHIGGTVRASEWEVLNALPGPHVDHLGNANDLSRFSDATFSQVYASHVLEHLDYKDELPAALKEWHRVLLPGGVLMVSVPDLDVLAGLLLQRDRLTSAERYDVMRMLFGGHTDRFDYHLVGLNQDFLQYFLGNAGFATMSRVDSFGLFEDSSAWAFKGSPISVNIIAHKAAA